jgi:predicted GH43/DUF377 family glycosyl hydrolase
MKWMKKGLLFSPNQNFGWMNSHAQVPTPLVKRDRLRVYFATRPRQTLSLTSYVDFDINDFSKNIYIHPEPVLEPGRPGEFDEHGIMPSSVVERDGIIYLYYSGWQRAADVPYRNYTGLAISEDGGATFVKYEKNPIVGKCEDEQYSATSPCVYHHHDFWHMWYTSGTHWLKINGRYEHTYDIKYAFSDNGKEWIRAKKVILPQRTKYEAITRPGVIKIDDCYHMWFCFRGSRDFRKGAESYRIGYATSEDLKEWRRNDRNSGIGVSATGWDSAMIAYPAVVRIGQNIVMLYNGNDFGAQGFGYAFLGKGG